MKPTSIAAALFAVLTAATPAAHALDLRQALDAALAHDAVLASARAQLQTLRERVPQARAGLLPTVNGTSSISRQMIDRENAPRTIYLGPRQFGVSLSQPLLRRDRVEALEQSRLAVDQGEAAFEAARQDLLVRVSQGYFDVLASQDALAAVRSQKRAIAEQLESAKRNFEVGTATITDQQEAQARFDLTTSQEIAAENDLANRRRTLSLLTGRPLDDTATLDGLRPGVALISPQPADGTAWTERARAENLAVRQAEFGAEIARREIERQRYGHWPSVDLVGSFQRNENTLTGSTSVTSNVGTVGVQLGVPLYAGGAIDARVREAMAARERSMSDLETARRSADQNASQLYRGMTSGLAQVRALEAAERSSQLALDSNLLGYQVGVRINIDVLNAQQQLYSTRRDLARARYDVLVNGLRLKQATGILAEADLDAVNGLLAPVAAEPAEATTSPLPPPPPPRAGRAPAAPLAPIPAPRPAPLPPPGAASPDAVPAPSLAPDPRPGAGPALPPGTPAKPSPQLRRPTGTRPASAS